MSSTSLGAAAACFQAEGGRLLRHPFTRLKSWPRPPGRSGAKSLRRKFRTDRTRLGGNPEALARPTVRRTSRLRTAFHKRPDHRIPIRLSNVVRGRRMDVSVSAAASAAEGRSARKRAPRPSMRREGGVRRQDIWRRWRCKLAESGPRLWVDVRRRACGAASADIRGSFA